VGETLHTHPRPTKTEIWARPIDGMPSIYPEGGEMKWKKASSVIREFRGRGSVSKVLHDGKFYTVELFDGPFCIGTVPGFLTSQAAIDAAKGFFSPTASYWRSMNTHIFADILWN
jgi:hypothetical protein